MISIEKAIKYSFSQGEWKNKFFILFIIFFFMSGISILLQFVQIPFDILSETKTEFANIIGLINILLSLVSIVTLPLILYIEGYRLKNIKSIVSGNLNLPEHTDIWNTILLGLIKLLISFIYFLPSTIIIAISFFLFIFELTIKEGYISFSPMIITSLVLFIISTILIVFTKIFLEKGATLEYIKTDQISAIFNVVSVFKTSLRYGGLFIQIFIIELLLQFILAFGVIFTICILFISIPFMQTYLTFITAYIEGNIYKEIIDNN